MQPLEYSSVISDVFQVIVPLICILSYRGKLYRRGTAKQEAEDYDNCQAVRDLEDGLQQFTETSEACQGTAQSGHRARHEGGASLVPKQVWCNE